MQVKCEWMFTWIQWDVAIIILPPFKKEHSEKKKEHSAHRLPLTTQKMDSPTAFPVPRLWRFPANLLLTPKVAGDIHHHLYLCAATGQLLVCAQQGLALKRLLECSRKNFIWAWLVSGM